VNAGDEIVGGDVFKHVRLRAGLERSRDVFIGVIRRENNDLRRRIERAASLTRNARERDLLLERAAACAPKAAE